MGDNDPKCAICGKRLADEEWIDDEEAGDVHVRCLNGETDEDDD